MKKRLSIITLGFAAAILPQAGWAQTTINHTGIVSAATFINSQPLSAGGLVAIFGSQLAGQLALADSVPLSTSLAGVTVTMNGIPAPLDFVAAGQINAQIPFEVLPPGTNGTINVVVNNNGAVSPPEPITINQFAPGVFTIPPGGGYSIAIIATNPTDPRYGSLAAPPGAVPGFPTNPAHPGDVLIVYATGLGPVSPSIPSGSAPGATLTSTLTQPTVLFGNVPSTSLFFSGLTPQFPGVYQLNMTVPQTAPGNSVPMQIQIGGITSPANAVVAITAQ